MFDSSIKIAALKIFANGDVAFHDCRVKLSPQETRFVRHLMINAGRAVSFASLHAAIAHDEDYTPSDDLLKTLAYKVRAKLRQINPAHGIETYTGTGYGMGGAMRNKTPASLAIAPGASFHARAMAFLDSATTAGGTAVVGHYALREALRLANMAGQPIQNETQWANAAKAFLTERARHTA